MAEIGEITQNSLILENKTAERKGNPETDLQEKTLIGVFKNLPENSSRLLGGTAVDLLSNGFLAKKHPDFDIITKEDFQEIITSTLELQYPVKHEKGKLFVSLNDDTEAHIMFLKAEDDHRYSANIYGHKIFFPEKAFQNTPIETQGGKVPILSPEILMQTLNTNRALGMNMREKDENSLRLIRNKYFPDKPIDSLEFIPEVL